MKELMLSEKKEIGYIQKNDFETFFSDIVKIDANPETVSLTFGIKSSDNTQSVLSHRVIMTLPHFFRLTEVCNKASKDMKEKIEKLKKTNK
jgi:hypothetical protein